MKEMGLPEDLDPDLARLSTDLGDLWSAHQFFAEKMESFLKPPDEWRSVGDNLADLKASVEHMAWHVKSVRRPLNRIANFAYRKALESEESPVGRETSSRPAS